MITCIHVHTLPKSPSMSEKSPLPPSLVNHVITHAKYELHYCKCNTGDCNLYLLAFITLIYPVLS